MQSPNRPHKIRQYLPYRKTPLFKTANASQTLQTSPCQGLRQTLTIPSAPPTAAFRAAQKNALQPLFKTLASLLKEPFFNPAREHKQDTKFKTGRKTFPNLTSFFLGPAQKISKLKSGRKFRPKAFKFRQIAVISRNFPYSIPSFKRRRPQKAAKNSRSTKAGREPHLRPGKIAKESGMNPRGRWRVFRGSSPSQKTASGFRSWQG